MGFDDGCCDGCADVGHDGVDEGCVDGTRVGSKLIRSDGCRVGRLDGNDCGFAVG